MTDTIKLSIFERWSVRLFFVLAVIFGTLVIPLFALWGPDGQALVEKTGIALRTNYIVAAQIFSANPGTGPYLSILILYPFTPTLAALTICVMAAGWPGVRALLARLRPWQAEVSIRSGLAWWATAAGTVVAILLAIAYIQSHLADEGAFHWEPGAFGLMPPIAWFAAAMFTDGGGWGEELGWRGFALPMLQSRFSPLSSAIMLGTMWSAWHWNVRMLDYGSDPIGLMLYLINFTTACIAITIIMTFFSNKVGGSALIAIMVHGLCNDSVQLKGVVHQASSLEFDFWSHFAMNVPYVAVALFLVVVTKGRLGFKADQPRLRVWTWPPTKNIAA
jgi:uncharacterized protein